MTRRPAPHWMALTGALALLVLPHGMAEQAPAPLFLIHFQAHAPGSLADGAAFGTAEGATSAYDPGLDRPKPPPPPDGAWLLASVAGPEGVRLQRSLVAAAEEVAWRVRVESDGPSGVLRVAWDAKDLDAIPRGYAVDATWGNDTWDLRERPWLEAPKPDGLFGILVDVRVAPLVGDAPSAPRGLAVLPGPRPGEATLSWEAPEHEGGHATRGYVVRRAVDGGPHEEVAFVPTDGFRDRGLEAGRTYAYAVSAVNRVGEGVAANASGVPGTGKPALLRPPESPSEERELAAQDARSERREVHQPPVEAPVARVRGGAQQEDPRYYEILLATPLGEERQVVVFTAAPVPQRLDADLVRVPGASAIAPAGEARAEAAQRDDGALVLRTRAAAGDERVEDETGTPPLLG